MFAVRLSRNQAAQPSNGAGLRALCVIDVFQTCFIDVLQGRPKGLGGVPASQSESSPPPSPFVSRLTPRGLSCTREIPSPAPPPKSKSIRATRSPVRPPKGGPPLTGKSQSGSKLTLKSKGVEDGWRAGFDALPRCGSPYLSDLERCLGIAPHRVNRVSRPSWCWPFSGLVLTHPRPYRGRPLLRLSGRSSRRC